MRWHVHEAGAHAKDGSYVQIHCEVQSGEPVFVVTCQRPMTDENRKRWVRTGKRVCVVRVGLRATFDEAKALGNKWGHS